MEKLGSYLLKKEIVSAAQLDEAVQAQVIFGGRLGTNLAELGYVSLDDLRLHLAGHLEIAAPDPEWLEQISEEARQTISTELVEKFRVLPLKLDKRKLHLVMLDPRDPVQLDEIAFVTGLTIVPYVLPEVQLLALIEHHYGVRRETRYISLGREVSRSHRADPEPSPQPDEVAPVILEDPVDSLAAPQRESEDLMDEELFSEIHERRKTSVPDAAAEPSENPIADGPVVSMEDLDASASGDSRPDTRDDSIVDLEIALARAVDRDVVCELALRIARCYAEAAALFVVRGGTVSGFRGDGNRISEQITGILLTAEFDSALTGPVTTRIAFRGPAPPDGIDANILSSLGRSDVGEIAVFPIMIRGQVVNLLYADGGPEALGETRFAALGALANLVSHTYERLIIERKSAFR